MPQLRGLVETVLENEGLVTQSVTARVKEQASALEKARRPDQLIGSAAELHDFLGLRVITYFADQVDDVAEVLSKNFDIDGSRTKDRRGSIDPDRFGYLSMHLSLRLSEERRKLVEWAGFADIWAEVQIRSSLQHSWAEIEHDLGYKSSSGAIPDQFRRRFSRLAGLLELADDEFKALRDGLSVYSQEVAVQLRDGGDAAIDQASLLAFIASSEELGFIDKTVADSVGAPGLRYVDSSYAGIRADELRRVGFKSIDELRARLRDRGQLVSELARRWLSESPKRPESLLDENNNWTETLPHGIGLFYTYLEKLSESGLEALRNSSLGAESASDFMSVYESVLAEVSGRESPRS